MLFLMLHAGVIWKGDSVIDGVPETLELLRSLVSFNLQVENWSCMLLCHVPLMGRIPMDILPHA